MEFEEQAGNIAWNGSLPHNAADHPRGNEKPEKRFNLGNNINDFPF